MPEVSRLIYIIDRFLEVSNVYHQILQRRINDPETTSERITKLIDLLESVDISGSGRKPLIQQGKMDPKGQSVVSTEEVLEQTSDYQTLVLSRLKNSENGILPRSTNKLKKVLSLRPEQFLGSFRTISYAWDILTELASVSVIPKADNLAARDMIHMHTVELKQHLIRLIAECKIINKEDYLEIKGKFGINELELLQNQGELVSKLAEFSVPQEANDIINQLNMYTNKTCYIYKIMKEYEYKIISYLDKRDHIFIDPVTAPISLEEADNICNEMVIYGLISSYNIWFGFAEFEKRLRGPLQKSILFCTRILLDEKRFFVCKTMAKVAFEIVKNLNTLNGNNDIYYGTHMIRANLLFAKRECGEQIDSEVRGWDTSNIHDRYKFLQLILLREYSSASTIGEKLLTTVEETGRTNLCIEEFYEWPILEEFRNSEEGSLLLEKHGTK